MGTDAAGETGPESVNISYIKSNFFRVVYAEGAFGGVSPRGQISFALYNERIPIPKQGQATLGPDGKLSEVPTDTRDGMVREVEVEVIMSIAEAAELARWLGDKVTQATAIMAAQAQRP
jgi:hypothetical protein